MIDKIKGSLIDESLNPDKSYNVLSKNLTKNQYKTLKKYFDLEDFKECMVSGKDMMIIKYKESSWIISENLPILNQIDEYLNKSNQLLEYRRASLMTNARDTPQRIKRSQSITNIVPADLNEDLFLTSGNLVLKYSVKNKYTDYVVLEKAKQVIIDSMKLAGKTTKDIMYSDMMNYLAKCMKNGNMYVYCSCPDFRYRFNYKSTRRGYNYSNPETRPAKITNPQDRGSVCKHLYAVLFNNRWIYKMIPQIIRCVKSHPEDFDTNDNSDDTDSSSNSSTATPSSDTSNDNSSNIDYKKIDNNNDDNDDNNSNDSSNSNNTWF